METDNVESWMGLLCGRGDWAHITRSWRLLWLWSSPNRALYSSTLYRGAIVHFSAHITLLTQYIHYRLECSEIGINCDNSWFLKRGNISLWRSQGGSGGPRLGGCHCSLSLPGPAHSREPRMSQLTPNEARIEIESHVSSFLSLYVWELPIEHHYGTLFWSGCIMWTFFPMRVGEIKKSTNSFLAQWTTKHDKDTKLT